MGHITRSHRGQEAARKVEDAADNVWREMCFIYQQTKNLGFIILRISSQEWKFMN